MQLHRILSNLLIAAALVGTPVVAFADPAPITAPAKPTNAPTPAPTEDLARYAQAEQQSPATADFEGGRSTIVIGGGVLTVVLIVLLIILLV